MKYPLFIKSPFFIVLSVVVISLSSCDEMNQEIYEPPAWLKGKLITQMKTREDLTNFISLLNQTGYDTILNTSGSFTVFAPTNQALAQFFDENPEYKSYVTNNDGADELKKLVEYQIIFNAWSKKQFSELDIYGWIDNNDEDAEPGGYKRETILQPADKRFNVIQRGEHYVITKPENSSLSKIVHSPNRKYVPIFYAPLLDIQEIEANDYQYYFNRPFNESKLYYAGAAFDEEIPAENGYIYITDKVNLPLKNAQEILEDESNGHSYKTFLNLIHQFSEVIPDFTATFEQTAALDGLDFDTLYTVRYPDLLFNINSEITGNTNDARNTVRYHHGLIAPTDQALETFFNQILSEWGDFNRLPKIVKEVIVNTHMTSKPIYPSFFNLGMVNGEGDSIYMDASTIVQSEYGSNCTFLGTNEVIIPRVLNSVSRPLYLSNNYLTTLYALEYTKVMTAVKKEDKDYSFFIPPDLNIGMAGDSTLVREVYNTELDLYRFFGYSSDKQKFNYTETDLRLMMLNQVGEETPSGKADIEFIRNLAGNYIVFDNVNSTARGSQTGSKSSMDDLKAIPFEMSTDNGTAYEVNAFFNFNRAATYYGYLLSNYSKFQSLLQKAGLFNPSFSNYPFLDEGEYYTLFVPTNEALEAANVDTLSKAELVKFLTFHFIKGTLIFTDGKADSGLYPTLYENENALPGNPSYKMDINTLPDAIQIKNNQGELYLTIDEDGNKTNNMIVSRPIKDSESQYNFVTTGVIHQIDKVLMNSDLKAY